jgi:hypothetical protein
MNKKIIEILTCMLLVSTAVPAVTSLNNINLYSKLLRTTQPTLQYTWNENQKLTASDGAENDWFGISISINGDTAIIGASADDNFKGSAYIFKLTGKIWTEQAKLIASDGASNDSFGYSVSLDGDTALIGSYRDSDYGEFSGSAYIFTRTGTTWTQQAKLIASDSEAWDRFGFSVSLYDDTALISAEGDNDNGQNSGSAYIFTRTGTTWTQQAKLIASDGAMFDYFGHSVSLDGDTALIGSRDDDDNGDMSGSAYIFTRTGTTWTQQAKLIASDGAENDWFGRSVSISGDTALITAEYDDDNGVDSGSAYVFTRSGDKWMQEQKLLASDGAEEDLFGRSVYISGDIAIIGADADDDNGVDSGSAYVFIKNKLPEKPTIIGEINGKPKKEYEYKFVSNDANLDDIEYCIDWGDNTGELWIGPYPSGFEASSNHTWSEKGNYTIRAKARDTYSAESEWATLEVSMPKNKAISTNLFLQRLIHRFPMFEKILNQIISVKT